MATKRSIILNGQGVQYNEYGVAGEEIKPGYLVKGVSSILKQTATTGKVPAAIAIERSSIGAGLDNTYQNGAPSAYYASGDTVTVAVCPPGTEAVGFVASGENITEDDRLESAGNGLFRELNSGVAIARAMETLGAVTSETALRIQFI